MVVVICSLNSCKLIKDKRILKNTWEIDDYKIKLYSGKGAFGPDYNIYKLHKNNSFKNLFFKVKTTGVSVEDLISCVVSFELKNEKNIIFNLCEKQLQTDTPRPKIIIDTNITIDIEVITINSDGKRSIYLNQSNNNNSERSIYLNQVQKNIFIINWNKNQKNIIHLFDPIYEIRVIENGRRKRIFYSDGYYVKELGNVAVYEFDGELFFKSLFN